MVVWRVRRRKKPLGNVRHGEWWEATSRKTVSELRRAFREQRVGGTLYDHVGLVEDVGALDELGRRRIRLQLRYDGDRVSLAGIDLCLSEIGIALLGVVKR